MKLDYSRVYIKNGNATKAVPAKDLLIDGVPLVELIGKFGALHKAYEQLTTELKQCHVVKKDTAYIIETDQGLNRINELKLYENIDTKLPLSFYKVEDGKIILDKKKVGAL